ncbi:MAG: Holliday junction resolvase RuvX [Actinomycetota bacterium]|nr:Holliday junction resolvase RuvX [Actinomycetota bacterium]MDQ2956701.1 Holliday junction resolvase RuvX [Actinomycetota bacterium]
MTQPAGVWLGIDVGAVRIGVARSDPRGMLAVPVATVPTDPYRHTDLDRIQALIAEYEVVGVVLGLPRTLAGREGPAAVAAREFGTALQARIEPVTVRYVDERMTTVLAQRNLTSSGVRGRAKRAVVDQAAAVEILQSFLDRSVSAPDPGGTQ